MDAALLQRVERWLDGDPDVHDRAELRALIQAADEAALRARFSGRLSFGTAGLRGPIQAGPRGMNTAVIRQSTAGLAEVLLQDPDAAERGVVVGFDARHRSEAFAVEATAVLRAQGIRVFLWDRCLPTPATAWALRDRGAAAAIQITASHNPPGDNGYKVYWSHGAQIIPPVDGAIADAIDRIAQGLASAIPCALPEASGPGVGRLELLCQVDLDRYQRAVIDGCPWWPGKASPLRVVYTALHGVGQGSVCSLLSTAGFDSVFPVAAQGRPDGQFPTVAFPNPEEDGALDLALAEAERVRGDLVIANDPDADRLALVLPVPGAGWRALTGNELGSLLGDFCLRHHEEDRPLVVASIVSSEMLGQQAAAFGAEFVQVLTGFKWIAEAARSRPERQFVFGFEEALGYCVGDLVADKDGVSAALAICCMAEELRQRGTTLLEHLETLQTTHGRHRSDQLVSRFDGVGASDAMIAQVDRVRQNPPAQLGTFTLQQRDDHQTGKRWRAGQEVRLTGPSANLLCLRYSDGNEALRVLVRPSGTEPKVKTYFEWRGEGDGAFAEARLSDLITAWKEAME